MSKTRIFFNQSFDKKRLKALISWVLKTFGEQEALRVVEELKTTGFRHATQAGISIGVHDLITPPLKQALVSNAQIYMNETDQGFKGARITATERSQRIIDTWHRASETLREQVVDYLSTYDQMNPVYIMALSGARGNFSQVRQLLGMRGLMADPQGRIISFPIRSNLREGLTLTEYFISCSGARKGLVDTALRTADTGYLTRRLVDVSHHVVVKRVACSTHKGIAITSLQNNQKVLLDLRDRLIGRVLAQRVELSSSLGESLEGRSNAHLPSQNGQAKESIRQFVFRDNPLASNVLEINSLAREGIDSTKERITGMDLLAERIDRVTKPTTVLQKDQEITPLLASKIAERMKRVTIRSPLTCGLRHEVCQLCYGWSLSQGSLVSLGEAVGVIAAQSIGEPGTQLTMRTFHTGGVFSGDLLNEMRAPYSGKVSFPRAYQGLLIRTAHGQIAFLTKSAGTLVVTSQIPSTRFLTKLSTSNRLQRRMTNPRQTSLPFQALTMLFVRQGQNVEKNQLLAESSILGQEGNRPVRSRQTIFAELSGQVVEMRGGVLRMRGGKEHANEQYSAYNYEANDSIRCIEPDKSDRLGLFHILATRIAAHSHPHLTAQKSFTSLSRSLSKEVLTTFKAGTSNKNNTPASLFNLKTIAENGDLIDSNDKVHVGRLDQVD